MAKMRNLTLFIFFSSILIFGTSCSKSYPCPGNGTMKAADLSLFDEDGNPKSSKGKKRSTNGLVGKKEPKRIHKRR